LTMATTRRDTLLRIQEQVQRLWEDEHTFEVDAPEGFDDCAGWTSRGVTTSQKPTFFVTFPYVYTNGPIHLGHAFSLSKAEFAVAYQRLRNRPCLFPFGFHCTGMPIQASATRLARELDKYGCPPQFPGYDQEGLGTAEGESTGSAAVPKKKVQLKTGNLLHQYDILRAVGVPEQEIPSFTDPRKWLMYWPPIGMRDAKALGLHVDWRRSFITTDANPYYDSFIRWQFEKLKAQGHIKFGKRYTIYSPLDEQACADHDRASGEGVQPQEYVLIKLAVLEPFPTLLAPLSGRRVFLAAATLRPETMYGQTNCWIAPEGSYGAYQVNTAGDVLIMTERAARNLAYQFWSPVYGQVCCLLGPFLGRQLIGTAVRAPLSVYHPVYVLPMTTVSPEKGTGVVTSVPSDSPDDYRALQDLKEKPAWRQKFGIQDAWILPFEPVPIIEVPELGSLSAQVLCKRYKIHSQNDRELLTKAKDEIYLRGFYDGVLLVGPYAGERVQTAKPRIRQTLLAQDDAILYSEPERPVISRSGDECVVALCDQWYIDYGEEHWKQLAKTCLDAMETYHIETRRSFEAVLEWLREWACSRSFGLGSRLPWDPQYVIESLSDSTIYMAYYTVAHLLHHDLNGQVAGQAGPASQLTPAVWDYVLLGEGDPDSLPVSSSVVRAMRREFLYWYPLNLRVSGKDLIGNHLTFFIYNHVAIFPREQWPLGVRANGHIMINNEKMSKSTGNFLTLAEAVERFSADAVRFALADAGDGIDDASFQVKTADEAILKLTTLLALASDAESMAAAGSMRSHSMQFWDRVMDAEVDALLEAAAQAYERLEFRDALKFAFYELQDALGTWRVAVGGDIDLSKLHEEVWRHYIRAQVIALYPICPHTCTWIWREVLHGRPSSGLPPPLQWPATTRAVTSPEQVAIRAAGRYVQALLHRARLVVQKRLAHRARLDSCGASNGTAAVSESAGVDAQGTTARVRLVMRSSPTEWQERCVELVQQAYDPEQDLFATDLPKRITADPLLRRVSKRAIALAMTLREHRRFSVALDFDEEAVLRENLNYLAQQLGVQCVELVVDGPEAEQRSVVMGEPAILVLDE
jgi:leucyl-tRNA synthetase